MLRGASRSRIPLSVPATAGRAVNPVLQGARLRRRARRRGVRTSHARNPQATDYRQGAQVSPGKWRAVRRSGVKRRGIEVQRALVIVRQHGERLGFKDWHLVVVTGKRADGSERVKPG
jgi:hypothetical protein